MQGQPYKTILAKAPFGYAYHRIIVDDSGSPVDYEFLEVNTAFERMTSLKSRDIIGKTVCTVIPGIREGNFDWVAHYGDVALHGGEREFEQFAEPQNKWFRIQVSSPQKGYFITLFTDISSQYKLAGIAQSFLTYTPDSINYQYIIDTACEIAGATYGTFNVFEENGRDFSTLAFSGLNPRVKRAAETLGIQLTGRRWKYDPVREAKIKHQKTTLFQTLSQLTGDVFAPKIVDTIASTFHICRLAVVKTEKQGRLLGDFTLLFTKENQLQNQALLETYADMTGLLLDRLHHEHETARERTKLVQITQQVTDIVWQSDLQLNNTYISPSVERILGFSVDEYLKMPIGKRHPLHPLQQFQLVLNDELKNDIKPDVDKQRTRTVELEHYKADGTLVPLEINISFVRDKAGIPIGLQGVSRDVSERKKLEADLQQQARLRELLMEISSGFINVSLEQVDRAIQRSLSNLGTFVNADRSYIFEYDWDKQVCNNTYEWCHAGIEPQLENLQQVPLDMMPDWVIAHKKGEAMIVADVSALPLGLAREILEPQDIKSVLAVPMMNNGQCIGFVGFDSVKQHRIYSDVELQLLNIFAQVLVNVVLRKEMVAQLIIAKERAEESDRLKSAFLANMSHEIRTPMNGILGFLDLLREPGINDEEKAGYIDIMNKSGERLLNTINDIIELSKIESGDIQVDKNEIDLPLFISFYYDFFSHQAKEKGLFLKPFDYQAEREVINTDRTKLDSILTNLIKNALKFTDQGTIEVGCQQKGDQDFLFYVKDTGKGIKPEKISAIFQRFIQEDVSYTRSHEGSGLGLSITKAYVEALGGRIWVESEPGKGSCFYFTLPA
jgi:PAS domain S-box-containing protein